jgi:hypothetical protein
MLETILSTAKKCRSAELILFGTGRICPLKKQKLQNIQNRLQYLPRRRVADAESRSVFRMRIRNRIQVLKFPSNFVKKTTRKHPEKMIFFTFLFFVFL